MNSNAPTINTETTDLYSGWLDLYAAGAEGVATWSDTPPPFLDKLKPHFAPGAKALETCSGDGRISEVLASWGIDLTTLDLSPEALKQQQANFRRRALPEPRMVLGSATAIPLADEQFDAVVTINGFCQLDRPRVGMSEAARVLRPGGKLLLDVFTPKDETFGYGEQIAAQDFLYKGTLFRYFTAEQFAGIYRDIFRVVDLFESEWEDPAHGAFRPEKHRHHALIYVLEKL